MATVKLSSKHSIDKKPSFHQDLSDKRLSGGGWGRVDEIGPTEHPLVPETFRLPREHGGDAKLQCKKCHGIYFYSMVKKRLNS